MYISVRAKFVLCLVVAMAWMALSIWLSRPWHADLVGHVGTLLATVLILFIAIVPGFMNAFLVTGLLLDKRPPRRMLASYPPLSVLIAAYNEEAFIGDTIRSIDRQNYPAELEVIVLDDGSQDRTAAIVRDLAAQRPWLRCISMGRNGGKARALNRGLTVARHELIVTLDADSCLFGDALRRIVERHASDPAGTHAVAGTTLARNSRESWLTKAQEWDYFHGIAAVKRVQSLNQGTLVAQGAFSLYRTATLRELGGWPETVGEDIVLTWAMLEKGYRVGYCENSIVFTNVPNTLRQFFRQRQRWARGMIEAFKFHPRVLFKPRLSTFFIWWDLAFPLVDIAYTLGFIPGLILAAFGIFWIAGPMTLSLVPLTLVINAEMYRTEKKMFAEQQLHVRRNLPGFLLYLLPYGMLSQPAAVMGYVSELLKFKKSWGTK